MTQTIDNFYAARIAMVLILGVLAAVQDVRFNRIPNRLLIAFLFLGVTSWCLGQGITGLWLSIASASFALLGSLPLFKLGALGGGDVKLFAVIAGITGFELFVPIVFLSFMVGGVVGFLIWLWRRSFLGHREGPLSRSGAFEFESDSHGVALENECFPFAPAILIGIFLGVLSEGDLFELLRFL